MNDIEIYTLPSCPYCVKAKKLLQSLNLPSAATVPQITINGHYVGGYTDLENMYKTGKLNEILNS